MRKCINVKTQPPRLFTCSVTTTLKLSPSFTSKIRRWYILICKISEEVWREGTECQDSPGERTKRMPSPLLNSRLGEEEGWGERESQRSRKWRGRAAGSSQSFPRLTSVSPEWLKSSLYEEPSWLPWLWPACYELGWSAGWRCTLSSPGLREAWMERSPR